MEKNKDGKILVYYAIGYIDDTIKVTMDNQKDHPHPLSGKYESFVVADLRGANLSEANLF